MSSPAKRKSPVVELFLCVFLGYLGLHRFYMGKKRSGILYLFTLGVCGVGWIADIVILSVKMLKIVILGVKMLKRDTKDPPVQKTGELITEELYAAGVNYYTQNIMKLAVRNKLWRNQTKTLLSGGNAGKSIFRYNFINKPVKLIPEPTNEHDENAVIVQIAGEKVGYIRAEEAAHVKNILSKYDVKYISSFISGGEYKIPTEGGDLIRGEDPLRVKVKIGYKA